MEGKFSPCSTGTPKSVEFAHKPPKQEMDLSCFRGGPQPLGLRSGLTSFRLAADGAAVHRDNMSSSGSQGFRAINVSGIDPRSYLLYIVSVGRVLEAHREITRPIRVGNNSLERFD